MPRIDVHCDEELYREAVERARIEGRSLSNLTRRALRLYLESYPIRAYRPTPYDSLTAPGDNTVSSPNPGSVLFPPDSGSPDGGIVSWPRTKEG